MRGKLGIAGFMLLALAGCDKVMGTDDAVQCAPKVGDQTPPVAPPPGNKDMVGPAMQQAMTQRSIEATIEQLSFQLCTARTNHWIDDEYYRTEMTAMREAAFQAMGVKSVTPAVTKSTTDGSDGAASASNGTTP